MRKLTLALALLLSGLSLTAQDAYRSFTPKDSWEVGLGIGLPFLAGDLDAKFPGFGGSLHARKALDHIFSLRPIISYQVMSAEGGGTNDRREADLSMFTGSLHAVATLNNFRYDKPNRKILFNVFAGPGFSRYNTDYKQIRTSSTAVTDGSYEGTALQLEGGFGIAYRVSPRFNVSIDHTIYNTFGKPADRLDGELNWGEPTTSYRDIVHFPRISLNFNLMGAKGAAATAGVAAAGAGAMAMAGKKGEPLYWSNPNAAIADAIDKLEKRPIYDPTDTDKDGIIDAIDEEDNSPAGARVDSKGMTLDSDGDKVPDYKDKEPFSPPGYTYSADGVANVPKPNYTTEADVNRIVDAKLANFKLPVQPSIADWFLPMVNFDLSKSAIRNSEYEKLYQVASVLKSNPNIKLAVTGHTDVTGSEGINQVLSFNRAKAAIDFLATQHGIARDRLVLKYSGEGTVLVPGNKKEYANRRVEFNVTKDAANMPAPPNVGRFKANTDTGY